jgi:N-acetylmuramoyl-L-alanine amidase
MKKTFVLVCLLLTLLTAPANDAQARRNGSLRTEAIDMVVIHSTGGPTCDSQTDRPVWIGAGSLKDNLHKIESDPNLGIHYMIDRDGTLRASVPEEQMVHHVYHYSGRSIAIELNKEPRGKPRGIQNSAS